jgi:hypothetical protein
VWCVFSQAGIEKDSRLRPVNIAQKVRMKREVKRTCKHDEHMGLTWALYTCERPVGYLPPARDMRDLPGAG